jgi:hypothetical protein
VGATVRTRFTARRRAAVTAAGVLGAAALVLTAVASAPARTANSCGPCSLVATIKDGSMTALLQATATSTPPRRSQNNPFYPTDLLAWRLTFHDLHARVSRATIRLGTLDRPGRYLFTLCGPCASGAQGEVELGRGLSGALNAAQTACHARRSPAAKYPLCVSVHLLLADHVSTRIAGELRMCFPNQYLHRNSCAPPGY